MRFERYHPDNVRPDNVIINYFIDGKVIGLDFKKRSRWWIVNSIEEQTKIIGKLENLMHRSAMDGYDTASCTFEYLQSDDGSSGVESKFHYVFGGEVKSVHMSYEKDIRPAKLVPQLHRLMHEHTGGRWSEFTLTLDKAGKATTKFKYPEA